MKKKPKYKKAIILGMLIPELRTYDLSTKNRLTLAEREHERHNDYANIFQYELLGRADQIMVNGGYDKVAFEIYESGY
jgi:hypothetical protein